MSQNCPAFEKTGEGSKIIMIYQYRFNFASMHVWKDKRKKPRGYKKMKNSRFRQKVFSKYSVVSGLAICLAALTTPAFAGDFDGSKPLSGTVSKIVEINPYKIIDNVDPDTAGLPKKFLIDFNARILRPSKDSVVQNRISFKSIAHIENKIVLQGIDQGVAGVDDALAWSLTISKKNGKVVLSASGDGVAYVVFGVCAPMKNDH
jgi:hypothetical protein